MSNSTSRPSPEIVEALYQLRTTLDTKAQRDRFRAVERLVHGAPEHPALTLLREIEWRGEDDRCPRCGGFGPPAGGGSSGAHRPDCRLAAILAGISTPRANTIEDEHERAARAADDHERTKTALRSAQAALADERTRGAAEEREACIRAAGNVWERAWHPGWIGLYEAIVKIIRERGAPDERPLRERVLSALEAVLPDGAQVNIAVTLPAKVETIETTLGFVNVAPPPPRTWTEDEIRAAWYRAQETGRASWERPRVADDLANSWEHVRAALHGEEP